MRFLAVSDRQGVAPDPHYLTHSGGPPLSGTYSRLW